MTEIIQNSFLSSIQLAQAPAGQGPGIEGMLFPILLLVGMYFLLFAPQMKKQKEHQAMLEKLQPGQRIITTGGIYGQIQKVTDSTFIVKINDTQTVEIGKNFIHAKIEKKSEQEAKGDSKKK